MIFDFDDDDAPDISLLDKRVIGWNEDYINIKTEED